jgi:hypothetical protein
MNTEKSVREFIEEWNAKAKAAGRYLDHDPGSVPPAEGSLLDVPETAEARARIAWLQQQIAELQQQQQRERTGPAEDSSRVGQEAQYPQPAKPGSEERPSAAGRA